MVLSSSSPASLAQQVIARRDATLPPDLVAADLPSPAPSTVFDLVDARTSPEHKSILELDVVGLAGAISSGRLSSVETFEAYARRAVLAQQLVSFLLSLRQPIRPDMLTVSHDDRPSDQLLDRIRLRRWSSACSRAR